jgi:hypothetical protein
MQPRDAAAAYELRTLSAFLSRQQERLDDRVARTGGDPMGSGGIASAHTCIGHVRLHRSGAWWYVVHANQRLALRCAKDHGPCDQVFDRDRQSIPEEARDKPSQQ